MTKLQKDKALAILNRACRDNLSVFTQRAFHTVDPGANYLHNWHIDCIAEYLKACYKRDIKRLIINVPPRYMKSISVTVAWPAWILGQNPSERIIASSYAAKLSIKHNVDCRLLMNSKWYRDVFPNVHFAPDENQKTGFKTTAQGHRIVTSVGGGVIGEGGNFLIVDDPHNPTEAASDVQRVNALDWFDQGFSTRLNDKENGVIVVVMQRLHDEDLTGHLLKKGGWEHLCLPATAPEKTIIQIGKFKKEREAGDVLHSERESLKKLEEIKVDLGSYAYAGQYQQVPTPASGGMVNLDWFGRYDKAPEGGLITQSWDTAIKDGINNDCSVCTTWMEANNNHYLIDVFVDRIEYPALKKQVVFQAARYNPSALLIEDKASGQSLIQDLRKETQLPIIPINPTTDKISRFAGITALIEAGRVILPFDAPWLAVYENEIIKFPLVSHDDQVDSTSQYLNWKKAKVKKGPSIRGL